MDALRALPVVVAMLFAQGAISQQTKPRPPTDQERIDKLQDFRIRSLENRVEASYASVNCNSGGFDSLMMGSPKLLMLVICRNIEPYLEGHRITLEVGNPHSFNFGGITGSLGYGKDWAEKDAELNFAGDLVAGRWTPITVIVNPSKPEEMRFLTLKINARSAAPASPRY